MSTLAVEFTVNRKLILYVVLFFVFRWMKQQARVPEFGKWENADNVGYTQYFDNARTKRTPGRMINPNDPTQNPEAFLGTEPGARKPKDARKQETDPRQKRTGSQSIRGSKVSGGVRSQALGHDAKTPERPRRRHGGRGNVTVIFSTSHFVKDRELCLVRFE